MKLRVIDSQIGIFGFYASLRLWAWYSSTLHLFHFRLSSIFYVYFDYHSYVSDCIPKWEFQVGLLRWRYRTGEKERERMAIWSAEQSEAYKKKQKVEKCLMDAYEKGEIDICKEVSQ